jgi:pimeloyl-ACP methyl ester carboxylesterase
VAQGTSSSVETATVDVDGVEVFHRRVPGEGEPAVFVHGNPTHSGDWLPFLEHMRGPALAFDLPGFGRSGRPDPARFDYSMRGQAAFAERVLAELGVREHSLVVHDWGALALIGAQRAPELVRRLVVINSVPLLPGYRWHRTARVWRTRRLGELSNRIWTRRLLDLGLRESRGDWSRHDPAFVDDIWDHLDPGTFRAVLRLYRSAPEDALAAAGRDLGSIAAPALVVWGGRDRYIPARFGRAYADVLPAAELLELPDAGHWPWREDPAVVPRVLEFLERA